METPRPVTAGPAEFPRSSQASCLSLPSCTGTHGSSVTPSFFRLSHLQPSASDTAERRQPFERRDASPLPLSRTLTPISWLALLADNFVAPPCPHCPQWGLRSNPKLSAPSPCQELSSSFVVQLVPYGLPPASASLFRDLLTAVAPSKRLLSFAFVILFARSSLQ